MIKKLLIKYHYYHDFIPRIVEENKMYLDSGTYKLDKFGELISHVDVKSVIVSSLWGVKSLNWKKKIIRLMMVKLFSKRSVLTHEGKYKGQAMKYSEDGVIKIFDFEGHVVLTIMKTEELASVMVRDHDYFSNYFNTTSFRLKDPNVIMEDYLETSFIDSSQKFDMLLECYGHYFKKIIKDGQKNVDYKIVHYEIQDVRCDSHETVFLRCHGDCWSSNILCINHSLVMIDFDRNGQYFFMYDLLTYIYCESFYNRDSSLLDKFIEGRYDHDINNFYKIFGLKWDGSKKTLLLQFGHVYIEERFTFKMIKERKTFNEFINKVFNSL